MAIYSQTREIQEFSKTELFSVRNKTKGNHSLYSNIMAVADVFAHTSENWELDKLDISKSQLLINK